MPTRALVVGLALHAAAAASTTPPPSGVRAKNTVVRRFEGVTKPDYHLVEQDEVVSRAQFFKSLDRLLSANIIMRKSPGRKANYLLRV